MTTMEMIDPSTLKSWLDSGEALLVDVREAEEFAAAHIPQAMSIPLARVEETLAGMTLPATQKLVFQCQKGGRGAQACALHRTRPAYNLEGGIAAWQAAGLPVIGKQTGGVQPLPLMRQVQIAVGALILLSVATGFLVTPRAFALAGFFGAGLLFAGLTGWCGMAMVLSRMPWNR